MWEIIKHLITSNWEFISTGLLALIIRLIEKAKNKKQLFAKIDKDFPELSTRIKETIAKK